MCAGNCVPEEVPAGGRTRAAIRPKNVCKCVIVCPLSVAIRALGIFIMICLLLAMSAKCELFSNEMVDGGSYEFMQYLYLSGIRLASS